MSFEADKSAPLLGAEDQPTLMEAGQQGTIFPTTPGTGMRTSSSMQGGATSFLSEAGESIEFLSPNLNQDPYTHPLARNGREDILNNTKHILETIYYVLLAATLPHLILVQLHNRLNIIIQSDGNAEPLRHNDADWHATPTIIDDAKCRFNFVALTVFPLSLYISSLTVFLIQFEGLSSFSFAEYFSMTSWTPSLWLLSISCYTYYIQNKLESAKQIQRSLSAASDNGWNKCLYGCSRTKVALSVWFPYGAYSLKKEIDLLESVSRVRSLRGLNMDTATTSSCACTSCYIFSYNGCSNGRLALPEILRIAGYVAAISAVSGSVAYAPMIKMTAMFVVRGFPFFKYTVTLFTFITSILCVSFILAYGLDRAKLIVFGIFGRVQSESLLYGDAPSHSSSPVQQAHDNVGQMLMV